MKKIVVAVSLASLLAGTAFAADIRFDYTGTGIFGGPTKTVKDVARNDCFALELKSDIAGVHLDWDIEEGNKLALDEFYGWLTFGLPVGNLQVTSGKWASRYVNRVNADAGDLDDEYYESYKPGVINGTYASDSDNLTEKAMSSVLAYTIGDLPGALLIKAGMVDGRYNEKANGTESDGGTDFQCGWVGEIGYFQEGLVKANVAVKNLHVNQTSFGVFVSPLMIENLDPMIGFSFGMDKDDSEFGIDVRARYAITEKVALTGMFNYSQTEIGGLADPTRTMWTMASLNYVAGENIRFLATVQNTVKDFDEKFGACITAFTPACEIKPTEKVTATAAVDIRWDNSDASGVKPFSGTANISIPIYLHVAL